MKTLLIIILTAATAVAAPYGINIPLPDGTVGGWQDKPRHYAIQYDSFFGGHWSLSGRRQGHGTFTDIFTGTVSNHAINGTFTQANFTWLGDSWYLENGSHGWIPCSSFTITISNGNVSGSATFRP